MSHPAPASKAPAPDDIRDVCAVADPIVRNLRITQTYYLLSRAMTERIGSCANWCTYAVWASRQAGCTIRAEDLISAIEHRLHGPGSLMHVAAFWRSLLRRGLLRPETFLGRIVNVVHTPFDAVEHSAGAVARGNLKVFEEIGFEFVRYLHAADAAAFIGGLEAPLLQQAFRNYEEARSVAATESQRAQHIFLANLQIGLHEQTRLQPEIEAALDAPAETAQQIGRRVLMAFGFMAPFAPIVLVTGYALLPIVHASRAIARAIITDRLMTLDAAGNVLRLGDHLSANTPAALQVLTLAELLNVLARFEPADCSGCGADDWSTLQERMHYIVHLFRAYQYRTELLLPPFDPNQVAELEQNRLPGGLL